MDLQIDKELEVDVLRLVSSGRYRTPEEVVSAAIQLLTEQEARKEARLLALRKEIEIGLTQALNGEGEEFSAVQFVAEAKARFESKGTSKKGADGIS